jgi:hypothetical protein
MQRKTAFALALLLTLGCAQLAKAASKEKAMAASDDISTIVPEFTKLVKIFCSVTSGSVRAFSQTREKSY